MLKLAPLALLAALLPACGGDPCADVAELYEQECGVSVPSNVNRSESCDETDVCVAECVLDAFTTCDDLSGESTRCYGDCN